MLSGLVEAEEVFLFPCCWDFIDVAVIVLFTIQLSLLLISANEEFSSPPSTFRGKNDDDNLLSLDKNCDADGCDGQIGAEVAAAAVAVVSLRDGLKLSTNAAEDLLLLLADVVSDDAKEFDFDVVVALAAVVVIVVDFLFSES
jgi:hypothetical protein